LPHEKKSLNKNNSKKEWLKIGIGLIILAIIAIVAIIFIFKN
jgi:hypothetical protein